MGDVIRVPRIVRTGPYSLLEIGTGEEGTPTCKLISLDRSGPPLPLPPRPPKVRQSTWALLLAWVVRNIGHESKAPAPNNVVKLDDRRFTNSGNEAG